MTIISASSHLTYRYVQEKMIQMRDDPDVGTHYKQRTTCIKAQKWSQTKLAHIDMNDSCVIPLTQTDMEIGDRHYIWGKNGVKGYDP